MQNRQDICIIGLDAQGKPFDLFIISKYTRHNFVLQNPVHEYLKYTGSGL